MYKMHNKELVENARELRKNMTAEERRLWYDYLKPHSLRFTRQKIIGHFIVDFYCARAKIAIELDGSQHYEPHSMRYDENRSAYLKRFGIEVIRIPNNEVNADFYAVCEHIEEVIASRLNHYKNKNL